MAKSIAILIPYFGRWPLWIDFFIESCRWNRSIDWILFHDGPPPQNRCGNVRHIEMSFEAYKVLVSSALGIPFDPVQPYKLCDIKPALPHIHRELVAGYDFVGFGDLDVVYGDIRRFYDDELLGRYDLLSSHSDRISGHFCLMRNCDDLVSAFERVPRWKEAFLAQEHLGFDEGAFSRLFVRPKRRLFAAQLKSVRCFFHEAYSTPGMTDRMRWSWKNGTLGNEFYPDQPFMYLHFMSWHSNRWLDFQSGARPGTKAPWTLNPDVVRTDWRKARKDGFMISPQGIGPIE